MSAPHLELKELRLKHNISQTEVAARCGLSRPSITAIEQGRQPMNLTTLSAFADALGYEVQIKFVLKKD
jgi:transcriptional regulator with XRE-family HTH domain